MLLGLEEEDSDLAEEEQKIKERLMRRKGNEQRQSQSQLFFQRKLGQSQETLFKQQNPPKPDLI